MDERVATFHASPRRPRLSLPPGATDTHCHVFGPEARFPFSPKSTYRPADAPKERLFALHDGLGFERAAIVQAGLHGFDNSVVADAIAARPGRIVGVALLPTDVDDATLAAHAAQGFRGVRFNFMPHLGPTTPISEVVALTRRLARVGMHLHVHMHASLVEELGAALRASETIVVIDHMGRIGADGGVAQGPFVALMRLMESEKFWVKASGAERASSLGPPHYLDGVALAARLVKDFPDRTLWGTDWPHPNFGGPPPDDGNLVDTLAFIAPDASALQALLVDNPQRLFRFGEAAQAGSGA